MDRRRHWVGLGAALLGASALIAGCSEAEPVVASTDQTDQSITRTIVELNGLGKETVRTETISLSEQRAEIEARKAMMERRSRGEAEPLRQAITKDAGCAGSSWWLFDQPGLAGNEICFSGAGVVDLSSYRRGRCFLSKTCNTWKAAVRSYWGGVEYADFSATWDAYRCACIFPYSLGDASGCEQNGFYFTLSTFACNPVDMNIPHDLAM